jgi:hypothetical protein
VHDVPPSWKPISNRAEFLKTVSAAWASLDPDEYPFTHHPRSTLGRRPQCIGVNHQPPLPAEQHRGVFLIVHVYGG